MADHAYTTDADRRRSTRRVMLLGAAVLPGAAAAAPLASTHNPDAELIDLCSRHPVLIAAVNASTIDADICPAWQAYLVSRDAIHDAEPQTFAGMRAKALAALAEAQNPNGPEDFEGTVAAPMAWELLHDLLRLTGGAA